MEKIRLGGFEELAESELEIVKKIIEKKIKKIRVPYQLLVIELKKHEHKFEHQARIIHEIRADLFITSKKRVSAKEEDVNLYKALDSVLKKIIAELEHKFKK